MDSKGKILLASPRGFCAGVVRAIDIVNIALERFGTPLFVRREIVHNKHVVQELRNRGTIFIDNLEQVPPGSRVIFSAHGVAPEVRALAQARQLEVIDATCPLVTKVHLEAVRYAREGYTIVLIGHEEHDEVIGTLGEAPSHIQIVSSIEDVDDLEVPDPDRIAYLTQTTLSLTDTIHIIERLRSKFPAIKGPVSDDICYATQNRQNAVVDLARKTDLVLVVGSKNSSNSLRLVEVAQSQGVPAYLIDDTGDIDPTWLTNRQTIGLTAGASAPEDLVQEVIHYLQRSGYSEVEISGGITEKVHFSLPPELSQSG